MQFRHDAGFSILEALIASALLAGAITVLLHLITISAEQAARTELSATAGVLAQAKLEQLRAFPFAFDPAGVPLDVPALAPSPDDAHLTSTPPYVEQFDRFGAPVEGDTVPNYVRRWSISRYEDDPNTLLLTVCVEVSGRRGSGAVPACVWTIRTRQP